MSTANPVVASSRSMPRRPSKPKAGQQVHISFYEPGEIVLEIDKAAERLTSNDPHGRRFTRTDAIRALIRTGLQHLK